jgi:hypothetical protein
MAQDMTIPSNVATLLYNIVNQFKIFDIVLLPLNNGLSSLAGSGTNLFQQITLTYNTATSLVNLKINGFTQVTAQASIITTLTTMLTIISF